MRALLSRPPSSGEAAAVAATDAVGSVIVFAMPASIDRPTWTWGTRRFWIDEGLNALLALSPRHVAALGHRRIVVWGREDGEVVRTAVAASRPSDAWFDDDHGLLCLRLPDGELRAIDLASGADVACPDAPERPALRWDGATYTAEVRWPDGHALVLPYPQEVVSAISCAPAAELVAVSHGLRGVDVRDARTGALVQAFRGPWLAALAPDGRSVALAGLCGHRVRFGAVASGAVDPLEHPDGRIDALRCSPDGTRLLVLAANGGWLRPLRGDGPALHIAAIDPRATWTADAAHLVGPGDHHIVRWRADDGAVVHRLELGEHTRALGFAADARGERVAAILATFPGGLMIAPHDEAIVWDLERGHEIARVPVDDPTSAGLELAPDGRRLALLDRDGARLHDLPDRDRSPPGPARRVAPWSGFHADGVRLHRDEEADAAVVRVRGGEPVAALACPHALAFATPPDHAVFAVGHGDGRVHVHRSRDFSPLAELRAPGRVCALAFAPDGGLLVAGGWDGTVHGYRLPPDADARGARR